ncbi:MAG: WYL domain-containing protein, partial [Oscillospiraceae bacterium]
DAIHTAINTDSKLSFKYFDYAPDKQRVLRREGGRYTVSPLSLNYAEENYYLFGYSDGVRTYRVDRMAEASVLNEPRVSNSETCAFDPAVCSLEMFSMYSGEHRNVDMLFENSLSTVAIDRFGADVAMRPQDDGHFSLTAGVMISPNFLAWVFSFAGRVKILSPQDVLERYRQLAQLACSE